MGALAIACLVLKCLRSSVPLPTLAVLLPNYMLVEDRFCNLQSNNFLTHVSSLWHHEDRKAVECWETSMKKVKAYEPIPVSDLLLPETHPAVVSFIESTNGQAPSATHFVKCTKERGALSEQTSEASPLYVHT